MDWLLLVYRLPSEPSKGRVAVWREVKKLGAVYLQNGVCLLPADSASEAAFAQLAERITGLGGEATLFRAALPDPERETALVAQFNRFRDQEYAEVCEQGEHFLAEVAKETRAGKFTFGELEEIEEDLEKLTRWLKKVAARDRFGAPGRERALARLAECQQAYEEFARRVFEQGEE
ncbi:MAG: Chromate resistance protein ChrB [Betaproteobacteria bacterium]